MKICLPVDHMSGLTSPLAPSYRTAPALLLVDSNTKEYLAIDATAGSCQATPSQLDAIVCAGGIGRGMFNSLRKRGVQVFNTDALTVADALAELAAGRLEEVTEVACCTDAEHAHNQEHPHDHHHDHPHAAGAGCGCNADSADHATADGGCCAGHS